MAHHFFANHLKPCTAPFKVGCANSLFLTGGGGRKNRKTWRTPIQLTPQGRAAGSRLQQRFHQAQRSETAVEVAGIH